MTEDLLAACAAPALTKAQPTRWSGAGAMNAPADATVAALRAPVLLPSSSPEPVLEPEAAVAPASALDLYAHVLAQRSLPAAAQALVNTLARRLNLARVSLALHQDGRTGLIATSDPALPLAQAESTQRLLGAMDEALEQARSLSWPLVSAVAAGAGSPAAGPILIEHQALHRLTGAAVATVPLGQAGEPFGALGVERAGNQAFSAEDLQQIEQALALAVPALRWMQRGDESSARRLQRDARRAWQALRQPERRTARRLMALGGLAFAFLAAARVKLLVASFMQPKAGY